MRVCGYTECIGYPMPMPLPLTTVFADLTDPRRDSKNKIHSLTDIQVPNLLAALDLAGAVVTLDAAGCQKATVEQIRQQGGGYVV